MNARYGPRKTGFTIVVAPLPETTVSGVVSYADGRPVAGAHVFPFAAPRKPTDVPSVVTDRDGTFELRVLAGLTYVMIASVETREGLRKGETTAAVDRETRGVRVVIREP